MWTEILDPDLSGPTLNKSDIIREQNLLFNKFNIAQSDPQKIERLKIVLALEELDNLVQEMQSAYQKVEIEFNNLKQELYLKKKA